MSISSFEVIDQIISHIAEPDLFPNLATIVVAGHSAGGQHVNRYAAGTRLPSLLPDGLARVEIRGSQSIDLPVLQ